MDNRTVLLIAGSSRVRDLQFLQPQNAQLYDTTILPNPGAGYIRIAHSIIDELRSDSITDTTLVIVYIIGGLCDVTKKIYHAGGCELSIRENITAIEDARDAKLMIRSAHPNTIVRFATVPVADLAKAKKHYIKHNKLWESIYSHEATSQMQKDLSDILSKLNKDISILNQTPQAVRDFDLIHPPQVFIHRQIEKISYTKRGARKTNVRKHIPTGVLPDGVHQARYISIKWFDFIHKCMAQLIPTIRRS